MHSHYNNLIAHQVITYCRVTAKLSLIRIKVTNIMTTKTAEKVQLAETHKLLIYAVWRIHSRVKCPKSPNNILNNRNSRYSVKSLNKVVCLVTTAAH